MASDRDTLRKLAVLIGGITMTILAMTADALTRHQDLDAAWQNYANTAQNASPAYRFPHASCFKAAAVSHGIPETLLLAVARGESDFEVTARSKANAHGVMQIQWPGT
ncbi:MAG: transglycosylase SLT domain-containing protein, partial [Pseudomonadota bacterium]